MGESTPTEQVSVAARAREIAPRMKDWREALSSAGECSSACPTCREMSEDFPGVIEQIDGTWMFTELGNAVIEALKETP